MKSVFRLLTAVAVVVFIFLSTPVASAQPRDGGWRDLPQLVKIVKKLQKVFGIASHEDAALPPRPDTKP